MGLLNEAAIAAETQNALPQEIKDNSPCTQFRVRQTEELSYEQSTAETLRFTVPTTC